MEEEEEGGGEPASEEQQEEQEETGREEETLQWNLPGWSVPMLLVLLGHVLHPGSVIHVLSPVFSTRLLSEQTRTNCYNWVITPVIIYFLSYQLSPLLSFSPSSAVKQCGQISALSLPFPAGRVLCACVHACVHARVDACLCGRACSPPGGRVFIIVLSCSPPFNCNWSHINCCSAAG